MTLATNFVTERKPFCSVVVYGHGSALVAKLIMGVILSMPLRFNAGSRVRSVSSALRDKGAHGPAFLICT